MIFFIDEFHLISIHALRGEGDTRHSYAVSVKRLFQSTPSVGRATGLPRLLPSIETFQSTPSVGRATVANLFSQQQEAFQSTPSVGRATVQTAPNTLAPRISIHALRGEGDIQAPTAKIAIPIFQSTPSVGRATYSCF